MYTEISGAIGGSRGMRPSPLAPVPHATKTSPQISQMPML